MKTDQIISPPAASTTAPTTVNTVNNTATPKQRAKKETAIKSTKSVKSAKEVTAAPESEEANLQGKKRKVIQTVEISDDEDDSVTTKRIKSDPEPHTISEYSDSDFTDEDRTVRE